MSALFLKILDSILLNSTKISSGIISLIAFAQFVQHDLPSKAGHKFAKICTQLIVHVGRASKHTYNTGGLHNLCTISGVGEGGGGAGGATAPPPPLFVHVCTLNERKDFLIQYVSHKLNVEQLNQNFCLILHQKLSQSTKTPKKFLGGHAPRPP